MPEQGRAARGAAVSRCSAPAALRCAPAVVISVNGGILFRNARIRDYGGLKLVRRTYREKSIRPVNDV